MVPMFLGTPIDGFTDSVWPSSNDLHVFDFFLEFVINFLDIFFFLSSTKYLFTFIVNQSIHIIIYGHILIIPYQF